MEGRGGARSGGRCESVVCGLSSASVGRSKACNVCALLPVVASCKEAGSKVAGPGQASARVPLKVPCPQTCGDRTSWLGPLVAAGLVAHGLSRAKHLDDVHVQPLGPGLAADDPALLDNCQGREVRVRTHACVNLNLRQVSAARVARWQVAAHPTRSANAARSSPHFPATCVRARAPMHVEAGHRAHNGLRGAPPLTYMDLNLTVWVVSLSGAFSSSNLFPSELVALTVEKEACTSCGWMRSARASNVRDGLGRGGTRATHEEGHVRCSALARPVFAPWMFCVPSSSRMLGRWHLRTSPVCGPSQEERLA